MTLIHVTAAELGKVRTLPLAILTAAATILIETAIAAALAASAVEQDLAVTATTVVVQAVPFAQVGIILLGILPAAHEHAGTQFRTTLAAVPNRRRLLTGKTVATFVVALLTAVVAVGAGLAAAVIAQHLADASWRTDAPDWWVLAGAVAYLALIAMLAHAVAVLVRHLVPALIAMLTLVLIIPPLLDGITEHTRWLPNRAGSLLYQPDADAILTTGTGGLVLLAWIIITGTIAAIAFTTRDA